MAESALSWLWDGRKTENQSAPSIYIVSPASLHKLPGGGPIMPHSSCFSSTRLKVWLSCLASPPPASPLSIHLTSLSSSWHLEFIMRWLGVKPLVWQRRAPERLMFISLVRSTPEVKWCGCCRETSSRGVHWNSLNGSFHWLMVSSTILGCHTVALWSGKLLHLFYICKRRLFLFHRVYYASHYSSLP